jgi:hypothetical protein
MNKYERNVFFIIENKIFSYLFILWMAVMCPDLAKGKDAQLTEREFRLD